MFLAPDWEWQPICPLSLYPKHSEYKSTKKIFPEILKNIAEGFGKSKNAVILVLLRDAKSFLTKKLYEFLIINSVYKYRRLSGKAVSFFS